MANTEDELLVLQYRLTEIEARESILKCLKRSFEAGSWKRSGNKTFAAYCVRELGYGAKEARDIAVAVGAIATSANLISDDPLTNQRIDRLRQWRKARARADGVAAYRVFTNQTLVELARARDLTLQSLFTIRGLGERKIAAFGKDLMVELDQLPPRGMEVVGNLTAPLFN